LEAFLDIEYPNIDAEQSRCRSSMINRFVNKTIVKKVGYCLLKPIPAKLIEKLVVGVLLAKTEYQIPSRALSTLLSVDSKLYRLLGKHAIRYGHGDHVKRRLTGYVSFLVKEALKSPGPYLDVGCASGYLTYELAKQTEYRVVGVDISEEAILTACARHERSNLEFVCGDTSSLRGEFSTIIASNVLEHIQDRVKFLKNLQERFDPKVILIRVPNFQRDWRIPLRKELGLDYFGDPTHFIEHTPSELETEITKAGLELVAKVVAWGEIWVSTTRASSRH
jgi:SAM-dependent methyltransferase